MILNHPERSSYIFHLAEEAGIPLRYGEENVIEDIPFLKFCEEYKNWSKLRDTALNSYLCNVRKPFRSFIPFSNRAFLLSHQVLWYFDELIVNDPIERNINPQPPNLEQFKENIRKNIQFLNIFRQSIDSGFLLLAGENITKSTISIPKEKLLPILSQDIISELDKLVKFQIAQTKDNLGQEWTFMLAHLDHGASMHMYIKNDVDKNLKNVQVMINPFEMPFVDSSAKYSEISKQDAWESIRKNYSQEIHRTLSNIATATTISSSILFDRKVDCEIVNKASDTIALDKDQALTIAPLNLVLPYIEGIPPNRLIDVRNEIPEAFFEFRTNISEIVNKSMKEEPNNIIHAQITLEKEINKNLTFLKTEMERISTKNRILGYGLPAISAMGILMGSIANIDKSNILKLFIGGAGAAVKVASNHISDIKKLPLNPYYFLWQAKYKK
jgi:hypothetical protein